MEAPVFQLSLVDHIRLSFGSVATSYRAHARAAERLSGRARQSRVVLVTLLGLSTGASLMALTGLRPFQIAAAALSTTALVGLAIVHASTSRRARSRIGPARRSSGCSAKSTARSSPTSTTVSSISPETTARRDHLMREVQNVYEHALPADREAYQIAREALGAGTGAPSDQDIDRLLPASLRQTAGVSPT